MTKADALKEDSGHGTLTDPENTLNPEFGPAQPFKGLNSNSSVHMTILTGAPSRHVKLSVHQYGCNIFNAQDHAAVSITKAGNGTGQRASLHIPRGDEHRRRSAESVNTCAHVKHT